MIGFEMGNKLGRKRHLVDEKYTRPQGLYQHKDVDHKKLRKLIIDSKLAPCYPGHDDCSCDREECPICFLVCVLIILFSFLHLNIIIVESCFRGCLVLIISAHSLWRFLNAISTLEVFR